MPVANADEFVRPESWHKAQQDVKVIIGYARQAIAALHEVSADAASANPVLDIIWDINSNYDV